MNESRVRVRETAKRPEPVVQFTAKEREFVYGVAMRYMKDEEDAHDVAQDAMLLAYRHLDSFRGNSRFTTWLYRIAATTALMHLRKRRRTPLMVSVDAPVDDDEGSREELRGSDRAGEATPEDISASTQALTLASEELGRMGDKYGRIFAMRFLEGYSEAEIASRLHLNVSTVKTRAYRARAQLRRHLDKHMGEAPAETPDVDVEVEGLAA
jgi:RNA polymerase sigma-70 factor (ECF subfamily)